jgi:cell division transport system permease protein
MIMRLKMVLAEAARSVTASMSTTVAATMTVLVGMFVLGLTIGLGTWVLSWSDHVKKQLLVKVYFKDDVTAPQVNAVGARLDPHVNPLVKKITFVSRDEALARMKKRFPELTANLTYNPLPASYEVLPKKAEYVSQISDQLTPTPPGVDKVNNGGKTSKRILQIGRVIWLVFLIGVIVLLVASTLLIANTIRLSIFSRRREIEVMKLVGATNWFVRGPFMVEGLLCGLGGSLAAVVLLLVGKEVALPAILGHIKDSSEVHAWPFELNALVIVGVGLLLGAVGSGLTLRRFLKV